MNDEELKEKSTLQGEIVPAEPVTTDVSAAGATTIAEYFRASSTAPMAFINEVFRSGRHIGELKEYKKQVSPNTLYDISENPDGSLTIYKSNQNGEMLLRAENFESLNMAANKSVKKIFKLAVIKAAEQCIFDGVMVKDRVFFTLDELVDLRIYDDPESARDGFLNRARIVITSLKFQVNASVRASMFKHRRRIDMDELTCIFPKGGIIDNQCYFTLDKDFDWNAFTYSYAHFPRWGFILENRPYDLLDYVTYLSRQNYDDIFNKGYFDIGNRSVAEALQLPFEYIYDDDGTMLKNRKPKQQIKDPYKEAIETIHRVQSEYYSQLGLAGKKDITLKLVGAKYSDPVSVFLDEGKLRVYFHGEYKDKFDILARNKDIKIKAAITHNEKVKVETEVRKNLKKQPRKKVQF